MLLASLTNYAVDKCASGAQYRTDASKADFGCISVDSTALALRLIADMLAAVLTCQADCCFTSRRIRASTGAQVNKAAQAACRHRKCGNACMRSR